MSNNKFNAEDLVIKDEVLINKYKQEFKNFFIPLSEDSTFDEKNIQNNVYAKSSEIIGYHLPIEVAICESDPKKESNDDFRIHLRIIDGRHRWIQSIKNNLDWPVKFYNVKDYSQYMTLRGHFDSKKETNVKERMAYFKNLCEYYNQVMLVPKPQVCSAICRDYSPAPFHEATIRRYISNEYKDMVKKQAGEQSLETRREGSIAELQKKNPEQIRSHIAKKNMNIKKLEEENLYLRSQLGMDFFETMYVIEQLKGNNWAFVSASIDEQASLEELNKLDPQTFRIRKIKQIYDVIYPSGLAEKKLYQRIFHWRNK